MTEQSSKTEEEMLEKILMVAHSYMLGNETAGNALEDILGAIKEAGYRLPAKKAIERNDSET